MTVATGVRTGADRDGIELGPAYTAATSPGHRGPTRNITNGNAKKMSSGQRRLPLWIES